jgi:oligoendopeptidase F
VFQPAVNAQGEEIPITQGTIHALLTDADREVRRTAYENYADAFLACKNAIASCIAAGVQQNVFNGRARRYPSAFEAAMSASFIPTEVFHNLIATFRRNLPTWHRYWEIRRKALGVDRLHVYDGKAPLSQTKPHIPYAQAVDWICEGMKPLGEEYVAYHAARLPRTAVGGRVPEPEQTHGGVLVGESGDASLHPDEL